MDHCMIHNCRSELDISAGKSSLRAAVRFPLQFPAFQSKARMLLRQHAPTRLRSSGFGVPEARVIGNFQISSYERSSS